MGSWLEWLHAHLMGSACLQGVQQQLGVAQAERDSRTRQLQDLQSRLQELQSALRRAQDPQAHRWALLSRAGKTDSLDRQFCWTCQICGHAWERWAYLRGDGAKLAASIVPHVWYIAWYTPSPSPPPHPQRLWEHWLHLT